MQFIRFFFYFCKKIFLIILQGVDRPNTTPIGQDRKFRDLVLYKMQLFIRICLRSGVDGRYSVTNGKFFFCAFIVYFVEPTFLG